MKKILFIDDDEILLDTFSTILEKNGFDVTAIRDGICLDSLINIDQFDVIVTDIVMPEKEGLQTIREIRTKNKSIPILAISGGGRIAPENHLALAKYMGADDFLIKPFDGKIFVEKIKVMLK